MARAYQALQKEYNDYQVDMKDKYETAQMEITLHENNYLKASKELKVTQERLDNEVKKGIETINQFNDERQNLKDQIKELKDENQQLSKQLNEANLTMQRGEVDSKIYLEQLKQEHESYTGELKMQITTQQRQITDFTLDLE